MSPPPLFLAFEKYLEMSSSDECPAKFVTTSLGTVAATNNSNVLSVTYFKLSPKNCYKFKIIKYCYSMNHNMK